MRARYACLCTVILLGTCQAVVRPDEPGKPDPIMAKLLVAEDEFETTLDAATKDLLARLDDLIERATRTGEFETLKTLKAQRLSFEQTGAIPDHPGAARTARSFIQARDRARKRLLNAYDLAITQYTRERQLSRADEILARRDRRAGEFSKQPAIAGESAEFARAIDPRGEPIDFLAGRTKALAAIWIDDLGICHVRLAPGATGRRFEGTVTVRGGTWAGPVLPVLTGRSRKPDRGAFVNESTFEYEIHTPRNGLDGLDFQVAGAGADLIFEMKSNGSLMAADSIVIGKNGLHPPGGHFVVKNTPPVAGRPGVRRR
jgi:hypothetical protein